MTPGSRRSAAAGPLPAGCPARGSADTGVPGPGGGGGGAAGGDGPGPGPPTTCTAAWPFRDPTRASTIATPLPTPVTVPLLSTLATLRLFDDQMIRTVGMTLPMRSNAVARSPLRSPTRRLIVGGATWTSATFCANAAPAPGRVSASTARSSRLVMARRNLRPAKWRCQANLSRRPSQLAPGKAVVHVTCEVRIPG
jgi:hypothetical protein